MNDTDGLLLLGNTIFIEKNKIAFIYHGYFCEFYKDEQNKNYYNKLSVKIKKLLANSNIYSNGIAAVYTLKEF